MFKLPDLPYEYDALEPHIDEETMRLHHDKHHATYVSNLNDALKDRPQFLELDVNELLGKLDDLPEDIRTKVRNNGGGHANHTLFWELMCPPGDFRKPEGKLLEALVSTFENLEGFKEKFANVGLGRFGSGWVWLVANGNSLEITDTPNQDTPIMDGETPILGLDVWEHAYYLKYKNSRKDYIDNWWDVVNWANVAHRFNSIK